MQTRQFHTAQLVTLLMATACGCTGSDGGDRPIGADSGAQETPDADMQDIADAMPNPEADADDSASEIFSTLNSDCGTLQGRAIVNFNGNLGISFTEADAPFTFLASVQFELPSGSTGTVPNPENWDGSSPRQVVAMTTPSFQLHGNHCWFDSAPAAPGSVTIIDYRPSEGIVKAQFNGLALRSCTGASVCTISGDIETTGQGVFD